MEGILVGGGADRHRLNLQFPAGPDDPHRDLPAPGPDAQPYIQLGQRVEKGQTLCLMRISSCISRSSIGGSSFLSVSGGVGLDVVHDVLHRFHLLQVGVGDLGPKGFLQGHVQAVVEVTAPMVGVAYAAPGPDAQPYIQLGQRVEKGQTLCLMEAMTAGSGGNPCRRWSRPPPSRSPVPGRPG